MYATSTCLSRREPSHRDETTQNHAGTDISRTVRTFISRRRNEEHITTRHVRRDQSRYTVSLPQPGICTDY